MSDLFGKLSILLDIIKETRNWPSVFLSYANIIRSPTITFLFKKEPKIILEKAQGKYETSGLATIWEIIVKKNYTPQGFEIKSDDVVIDIGANIGVFTLYAAKKAFGGKVYSFEPFKSHYNRLLRNISFNNLKNVKAFNLAISQKKGKQKLFFSKLSSGMHSLFPNEGNRSTMVNSKILGDIIREEKLKRIDFMKLDCEGAEYEILYGLKDKNLKIIKKIAVEYENMDNLKNNFGYLKSFLIGKGFKVISKNKPSDHQGILYALRN